MSDSGPIRLPVSPYRRSPPAVQKIRRGGTGPVGNSGTGAPTPLCAPSATRRTASICRGRRAQSRYGTRAIRSLSRTKARFLCRRSRLVAFGPHRYRASRT